MKKLIGTMLAHYRIDEELGHGGMGWVFLALDTKLDRQVAVKVMNPGFAHNDQYVARFIGEAKIAASLKHPGIVTVHDHDHEENDGYLYIVMEYIEGGNLQEKLKKEKKLKLPEVITLTKALCDALHYAHQKDIIHRDIKPANIMIREDNTGVLPYRPIIADLGLSKSMDSSLTQTGDYMGTLAYVSPEQALGKKEIAATTDIYSLGLVCYELLVGQSLFDFESFSAAVGFHQREEPRPEFDPSLPREIEPIIQKCLERDPLARYQTARELAEALSTIGAEPRHDDTMVPTRPPVEPDNTNDDEPLSGGGIFGGFREKIEGFFASDLADERIPDQDNLQITSANKSTYFAIESDQNELTIGSDKRNDLRLKGSSIAAHHVRLKRVAEGYQVVALNNEYDTRIGSANLSPHQPYTWSEHDLLHIGDYHLWLIPAQQMIQSELRRKPKPDRLDPVPPKERQSNVGIGVHPERMMVVVDPGREAKEPLKLTNKGDIVDHFIIGVEGLNEAWVTLPPDQPIELNPNKTKTVNIHIQPPRTPESRAGDYDFTVHVTSSRDASARLEIPGKLTVRPFYHFKLDMRPLKQEGGVAGNFDVHLNNQSNTDIPMQMQGRDREDACDYIFEPEQVTVHAGAKQVVDLTVRPQGKLVRQASRSYNFTVTADVDPFIEPDIPEGSRQIHGEWVHAPPQFDLRLEPAYQRGVAEGHFGVIIDNRVQFDITVHLSATDPRKQCDYVFETDKVRIPVGEDRQVQLRVIPNTPLPGTEPREIAFTVTARPASARQLRTDVPGRWEQIPPPFDFILFPQTYTSRDRGRFTVKVLNQSDADLTFNVAGRVTNKKGDYTLDFEKTHIEVAAGDTRTIPLRVISNDTPPKGETWPFPFVIRVWPAIAPHVIHEKGGEWLQHNPLGCRFWLSWVLALTLCLLIAFLAGYTICDFGSEYAQHLESKASKGEITRPVRIFLSPSFDQLARRCGFDLIGLSAAFIGLIGLIIASLVSWRFWEDHEIPDGLVVSLLVLAMIPVCGAFLYAFDELMGNETYRNDFYRMITIIFDWVVAFISEMLR